MQDEVSALSRMNFDGFQALIRDGVAVDAHPAFAQVFLYYWTKLFGTSEFIVKLPSYFCGALTMLLSYRLWRSVYGHIPTLAVLVIVALGQYFTLYFSLARPYAYGTFFVILQIFALWNWKGQKKTLWMVLFVLGAVLSAYTHYFSSLASALVAIWGFLILPKTNRLHYALACVAAVILFLPHLQITLGQLGHGGLGGDEGWLGAPEPDALWRYLRYLGGYTLLGTVVLLASIMYSLASLRHMNTDQRHFAYLGFGMMILLGGLAYFYSVQVNPIFQFSILIFAAIPFLTAVFGAWSRLVLPLRWSLLTATLAFTLYGYYVSRAHPAMMKHQPIHEIASWVRSCNAQGQRPLVINGMNENFLRVYNRDGKMDHVHMTSQERPLGEFAEAVLAHEGPVIAQANTPWELTPLLLDLRPEGLVAQQFPTFNIVRPRVSYDLPYSDYLLDTLIGNEQELNVEFGANVEIALSALPNYPYATLDLTYDYQSDTAADLVLVCEIIKAGEQVAWYGKDVATHGISLGEFNRIYHSLRVDEWDMEPNDLEEVKLKIYLWNRSQNSIQSSALRLRLREDIPCRYGLYEELRSGYPGPHRFLGHTCP